MEPLQSCSINNEVYTVGDCIVVRGEKKAEWIAQLVGITPRQPLTIKWFYWPDDPNVPGGRKAYHGRKELFSSNHEGKVSKPSVLRKCRVLSLDEYEDLNVKGKDDFYSRWSFDFSTKLFAPDKVDCFCSCGLPYNPDLRMIMCSGCKEWFHCECIGLDPNIWIPGQTLVCNDCERALEQGGCFHGLK